MVGTADYSHGPLLAAALLAAGLFVGVGCGGDDGGFEDVSCSEACSNNVDVCREALESRGLDPENVETACVDQCQSSDLSDSALQCAVSASTCEEANQCVENSMDGGGGVTCRDACSNNVDVCREELESNGRNPEDVEAVCLEQCRNAEISDSALRCAASASTCQEANQCPDDSMDGEGGVTCSDACSNNVAVCRERIEANGLDPEQVEADCLEECRNSEFSQGSLQCVASATTCDEVEQC